MQCVVANNYDSNLNYYDLIQVEFYIRNEQKPPNIYFLVFFASCREFFYENNLKNSAKQVIKTSSETPV